MSRKSANMVALVVLAAVVIFGAASCKKLSYGYLMGNYHFNSANNLFRDQKYRDAIEEYETAIEFNPDLVEAYRYLGESYKALYKPGVETERNIKIGEKVLKALNDALEIYPDNKEILHSLADMYDKMQNFDESEKLFLKILEMEPTNMDNYYVVAGFYKRYSGGGGDDEEAKKRAEDNFKKAEQMYLRRIETDPDNPEGYSYIAQFYDDITPIPDFDKACEYHRMRLKLDPDNAVTYYAIGVNRFSKAFRLQNMLSRDERIALGNESEQALLKSIDLDALDPNPYAYMKILYINVFAKLYPDKAQRYTDEADQWGERFQEIRKRELDRKRLERELTRNE